MDDLTGGETLKIFASLIAIGLVWVGQGLRWLGEQWPWLLTGGLIMLCIGLFHAGNQSKRLLDPLEERVPGDEMAARVALAQTSGSFRDSHPLVVKFGPHVSWRHLVLYEVCHGIGDVLWGAVLFGVPLAWLFG